MKKILNSCFFAAFALVSFALMTTSLAGCNHSSRAGGGQKSETQYTISFELNGGQWVSGYTATTKYKASNGATLPASSVITKSGYTFAGWYGNADFSGTAVTSIARGTKGNKSFWAKWEISEQSYTVHHLLQNLNDNNYTEAMNELQQLTGTPGQQTAAEAKNITGFTAQTFTQQTIAADGSTEVSIRYTRHSHTVSYQTSASGIPSPTTYKFGATVTVVFTDNITTWGYGGHTYTSGNNTFTMPDADVMLAQGYSVTQENIAATLNELGSNTATTPHEITVASTDDLSAIIEALKDSGNSDKYVSISLESSEDLTEISGDVFAGCTNITSITVPSGVETIGEGAFEGCTNLTEINLPDSVTTIGESAFEGCSNLSEITIPNGVEEIGTRAFKNTNITSITIPGSVESVGYQAFDGCAITSVTFGEGISEDGATDTLGALPSNNANSPYTVVVSDADDVSNVAAAAKTIFKYFALSLQNCTDLTIIDDYTFSQSQITSINLPITVTTIGDAAFDRCQSLTNITIPNNVTSIGQNAFIFCESLTEISIPDSVISIGNRAFAECEELEGLTLGENVTTIGESAFCNNNLTNITIPDSVTTIGSGAFYGCRLTSVTIPDSVTSLGNYALFSTSKYTEITIPARFCNSLKEIFSDPYLEGNCLSDLESITITRSQGNSTIEAGMLSGCQQLTSVTIPIGITSIGNEAFQSCVSLETLIIPNTVTSIGNNAFNSCIALQDLTMSESVTSIGQNAFESCIGLTNISLPNTLESIGNAAFLSCQNLSTITFTGTTAQWNAIPKGDGWNYDCPANMQIICTGDTSE